MWAGVGEGELRRRATGARSDFMFGTALRFCLSCETACSNSRSLGSMRGNTPPYAFFVANSAERWEACSTASINAARNPLWATNRGEVQEMKWSIVESGLWRTILNLCSDN